MSKKSKTKAALKRKSEKRARKEANQARYKRWAEEGRNRKTKRGRAHGTRKGPRPRNHPHGPCGNPGCHHCFGVCYKPFLRKGEPHGMPNWMYRKWTALTKAQKKAARKGAWV